MKELLIRVVVTAVGMYLGYFLAKMLEQKNGIVTNYINIMKEKKKNLQSHGVILAVALVLCIAVISVFLNLSMTVEAFAVGLLLGPLQLYFMTLQKMDGTKSPYVGDKKKKR